MTAEHAQPNQDPAGLPTPQFGDEMHPLLKKLMDNIKPIAIGFGALIIIFGGYGIYDYVSDRRLESSSAMLGEILASTRGEERVKALRGFLEQAPEVMRISALFELAATLQEQDKYEDAVAVWTRMEGIADAAMAPVVKLGKARALAMNKQYPDALGLLEAYQSSAPEAYKTEVTKTIAELAEDAGDTEKALTAYRELAKSEQLGESARGFLEYKIEQLETDKKG